MFLRKGADPCFWVHCTVSCLCYSWCCFWIEPFGQHCYKSFWVQHEQFWMFGNVMGLLYNSICTVLNLTESFRFYRRNWANCFPTELFHIPLILHNVQLDVECFCSATPRLHREKLASFQHRRWQRGYLSFASVLIWASSLYLLVIFKFRCIMVRCVISINISVSVKQPAVCFMGTFVAPWDFPKVLSQTRGQLVYITGCSTVGRMPIHWRRGPPVLS